MDELRRLLFDKGRVGDVLKALSVSGAPDPKKDPRRALLYGHALCLYGDYHQAISIFENVPPRTGLRAERAWGTASALIKLGNLEPVAAFLDKAAQSSPSRWLLPQIYNARVNYHICRGQFDEAKRNIDLGVRAALKGSFIVDQLILEGNRGVINICQNEYEEAVFRFNNVIRPLLIRDSVLAAAHFLINLSSVCQMLGDTDRAEKCLRDAGPLIEKSGSRGRLIFLRQVQGNFWRGQKSNLAKAEAAFNEALDLMRDLPDTKLEIHITDNLAEVNFAKGNLSKAVSLAESALEKTREKGIAVMEDLCLLDLGIFALRSGKTEKGISLLEQARRVSESFKKHHLYFFEALYLAQGYALLKMNDRALEWFNACLAEAKLHHIVTPPVDEAEILTALLLGLGEDLPQSEFLSGLITRLRNPVLIKRLLRQEPGGKSVFLKSLRVLDARHFRPQLAKLKDDPAREVRQTCRRILQGWQDHAALRVYTLGSFRVFFEGQLLGQKDWIIPGVQRLFLFFVTNPDQWHTTDSILETLWTKPHPKKTLKVLNNLFSYLRTVFEPWHLPGMDYVFFQSRHQGYGFFRGERFEIDAVAFLEATRRAEKAHAAKNLASARQAFRDALNLYQGDYLAEFPYEDWLNQKRAYLTEVYFRSVLRYATLEREFGDLSEARRVLEDALFKDLSRSGCAALLIRVLIEMKLTSEVKEWARRHIDFLHNLGEKPAPELIEALKKISPEPI